MGLTEKELLDFLERDYERKIEQLHRHLLSIWTRFNFFITFQGLIISSRFLTAKISSTAISDEYSVGISILGLATGIVWYCFSANDRYLVKVYRNHNEEAFLCLHAFLEKTQAESSELRCKNFDMSITSNKPVTNNIFGWRYPKLGLTDYATMVPLVIILFWVSVLICGPALRLIEILVP